MHLLFSLIKLCTLTLNLLRRYRRNPIISAYTAMEGTLDFNKTPLSPPVFKVVINGNPDARRTWWPHGSGGLVHWTSYGALKVSPDICEHNNIIKGWVYGRDISPSHQDIIHIFIVSRRTGCSILNKGTTISKSWDTIRTIGETRLESLIQIATLFQTCFKKTGATPRVEKIARKPLPPRVENRINSPSPRVCTPQTPQPAIP